MRGGHALLASAHGPSTCRHGGTEPVPPPPPYPHPRLRHTQAIKLQYNAGGGGCFPMHYDSDEQLDGRRVTAIFYLNPEWVTGRHNARAAGRRWGGRGR